jgi:hypothetical protein
MGEFTPPTSKQWRGLKPETGAVPVITLLTVFGWKVHRHEMPVGSCVKIFSEQTLNREDAPNLTFQVKGESKVTNSNGGDFPNRVAGMFSGDRGQHPAGLTTLIPMSDVEFWCFNYHYNRRRLPELTPIRLRNAESLDVPEGSKVLLCLGSVGCYTSRDTFLTSEEKLVSQGDSYLLMFKEEYV